MPRVQGVLPEPKLAPNRWKDPEPKPLVDMSLLKRGENSVNFFSLFLKRRLIVWFGVF